MKYIVVDLDDTLLTDKKEISEYTLNSLKKFQDKGYNVVFNTARNYKSAFKYIDKVKPDYSIINGGAQIFDKFGALIYVKTISIDVTNKILEEIKKDEEVRDFSVQGENELYSPNFGYCQHVPIAHYYEFKEPFFERSVKILISSPNLVKWKKVAKEYDLEFEAYFEGRWFRLSPSNKYKGNQALYSLLKDNDVKDYVFGDDFGDIEMISKAYHGVFLSNSNPVILKDAKYVTKYDNNNDGIVRYLEELGD